MNVTEAQWLLQRVENLSGQQWPQGAASDWHDLLANTDVDDAAQAVREWYDQPEPPASRINPGWVRRRALAIKEVRQRAEQRALPAGNPGVPPNPAYLRARAQLAARLGDLDREPARRLAVA